MVDTYTDTRGVIVWLGPGRDGSVLAMAALSAFSVLSQFPLFFVTCLLYASPCNLFVVNVFERSTRITGLRELCSRGQIPSVQMKSSMIKLWA